MWARKGLLARYLEAVGEVLDRLAREREVQLAPATSISILAFLTSLAAFASPLPLRPGSFLLLALAFLLAALGRELRTFLRTLGLTAAWLAVVVLPLLLITPGEAIYTLKVGSLSLPITREGASRALEFSLRCLSAISLGVAWTGYVGLNSLLRGLALLDPTGTLPGMAFLTARYVPLSVREAGRLLAAREARLMGRRGLRSAWLVLASSCGELLLRAYHRAWRVGLAMRSRCLSGQLVPVGRGGALRFGALDALWALVAGAVGVLYITKVV